MTYSDNIVKALCACECKTANQDGAKSYARASDCLCSVRGCPHSFPVYKVLPAGDPSKRCSGQLEVIVQAERPKARVIVAFTHPTYAGKMLPLVRNGTDAQTESITLSACPEMVAAVAQDMQLFDDPMFFTYIHGRLKLLYDINYNTFYKLYGQ